MLLVDTTQYSPSSPLFAEAMERASTSGTFRGEFVDEAPALGRSMSRVERVLNRIRRWPHRSIVDLHRVIVARAEALQPTVVLVVKGAHLTVDCLAALKSTGATIVNFATDDPFNPRTSTALWRRTLPMYDVVCTPRRANIDDLKSVGVSDVCFVPFGYKAGVHFAEAPENFEEQKRFESDVCFIGGADPDRVVYFEELVRQVPGVKLALYGGYWNRSPRLAPFWRGYAVGREFRLAVGGAAISVNLVRRANRDDHVMRTFEVPACGGCMLTEPTPTHRELFRDGEEAFFFDSPASFIDKVRFLLDKPEIRRQAAAASQLRITQAGNRYDDRLATIIERAQQTRQSLASKESLRVAVSA
jgi:spore maturation protein CgeB